MKLKILGVFALIALLTTLTCAAAFAYPVNTPSVSPAPTATPAPTPAPVFNISDFIQKKSVAKRDGTLTVTGDMPVAVIGSTWADLQSLLNGKISALYDDKQAAAKKSGARSIDFAYNVTSSDDIYSILIKVSTTAASTRDEAFSFVFRPDAEQLLSVDDVMGITGDKIISRYISDIIKKYPSDYNVGFNGISADQTFYVDDGELTVVFNKYDLGPGVLGMPEFSFSIDDIAAHTFTVALTDYITEDLYNLKMIPLRAVCEGLGFTVSWSGSQKIDITGNGVSAEVTLGTNSYTVVGQTLPVTLEAQPESKGNITYVPISFFEQVLKAVYAVGADGSVTFSVYMNE